jgi:cardiolipin synthase
MDPLDTDIPSSDSVGPAGPEDPSTSVDGRSAWFTIPNLLSLGRLVLTPVLVWLILTDKTWPAFVLFGAMGVSDYLDGYIARRTNTVTDLGTTLDPVSDRVLAIAGGIALIGSGALPAWLGIPVLLRDAVLSVVFLALARRGFGKPKVRRVGKTATFALFSAMPLLLLGTEIEVLRTVGLVVFGIGAVLYYVAFYRYYQDVQEFLARQRRPFAT